MRQYRFVCPWTPWVAPDEPVGLLRDPVQSVNGLHTPHPADACPRAPFFLSPHRVASERRPLQGVLHTGVAAHPSCLMAAVIAVESSVMVGAGKSSSKDVLPGPCSTAITPPAAGLEVMTTVRATPSEQPGLSGTRGYMLRVKGAACPHVLAVRDASDRSSGPAQARLRVSLVRTAGRNCIRDAYVLPADLVRQQVQLINMCQAWVHGPWPRHEVRTRECQSAHLRACPSRSSSAPCKTRRLRRWRTSETLRAQAGGAARAVVESGLGADRRTWALVRDLLGNAS